MPNTDSRVDTSGGVNQKACLEFHDAQTFFGFLTCILSVRCRIHVARRCMAYVEPIICGPVLLSKGKSRKDILQLKFESIVFYCRCIVLSNITTLGQSGKAVV